MKSDKYNDVVSRVNQERIEDICRRIDDALTGTAYSYAEAVIIYVSTLYAHSKSLADLKSIRNLMLSIEPDLYAASVKAFYKGDKYEPGIN